MTLFINGAARPSPSHPGPDASLPLGLRLCCNGKTCLPLWNGGKSTSGGTLSAALASASGHDASPERRPRHAARASVSSGRPLLNTVLLSMQMYKHLFAKFKCGLLFEGGRTRSYICLDSAREDPSCWSSFVLTDSERKHICHRCAANTSCLQPGTDVHTVGRLRGRAGCDRSQTSHV